MPPLSHGNTWSVFTPWNAKDDGNAKCDLEASCNFFLWPIPCKMLLHGTRQDTEMPPLSHGNTWSVFTPWNAKDDGNAKCDLEASCNLFCGPFPAWCYFMFAIDECGLFPKAKMITPSSAIDTIRKKTRNFWHSEEWRRNNGHEFKLRFLKVHWISTPQRTGYWMKANVSWR